MKIFVWVAFVIFTLFCIIIAVSNPDVVAFRFDPFPFEISLPLYMLVFLGILIGLGAGWLVAIQNSFRHSARHRRDAKRIKELEKQLVAKKP